MVGDSRTDIDTAKAAGIPVVAVDFGYTDRHVREFEPSKVISHFDELTLDLAERLIAAAARLTASLTSKPAAAYIAARFGLRAVERAISSAGEHTLHTGGVAGSIPASPTIFLPQIDALNSRTATGRCARRDRLRRARQTSEWPT